MILQKRTRGVFLPTLIFFLWLVSGMALHQFQRVGAEPRVAKVVCSRPLGRIHATRTRVRRDTMICHGRYGGDRRLERSKRTREITTRFITTFARLRGGGVGASVFGACTCRDDDSYR